MSKPISVVILCANEELNLSQCLASCQWCDDVHIVDSGSTDKTVQIARDWGAQVHVNPFQSFGQQRNWAIDNINFKYEWQFHLDADERFTDKLAQECAQIIADEQRNQFAAYYVADKLYFMGRWLKHSADFPRYQMRFFHAARCRFQDHGHGQRELTEGKTGYLKEPLIHLNFSKGLEDWFVKHNKYSTLEARVALENASQKAGLKQIAVGSGLERRRALKSFSYKLPARPLIRFLYLFIAKKGYLDGKPGFNYCLMVAIYEAMIELKRQELKWKKKRG